MPVDGAGMFECFLDRFFGDFMKDYALGALQSGRFLDVPGDSLALAVGVGRQKHFIGLLGQ